MRFNGKALRKQRQAVERIKYITPVIDTVDFKTLTFNLLLLPLLA